MLRICRCSSQTQHSVLLEGGDQLFVGNAKGYVRLNLAMPRAMLMTGLEPYRRCSKKASRVDRLRQGHGKLRSALTAMSEKIFIAKC